MNAALLVSKRTPLTKTLPNPVIAPLEMTCTLCAVACGVTDAWCDMIDDGHGVWDYLASVLILEEAGGVAAEVFGRELCTLDHGARRSPAVAATSELLDAVLGHRRR